MKSLAERLKWAREKRGVSCAGLDKMADLTPGQTAAIERKDKEHPSAVTVYKLATALGVSMSWLTMGGALPRMSARPS